MMNYPKIESFNNGVAIVDFGPEYKKKEILYTEDQVKANTLDNPEFLDYLKGFTPDLNDVMNQQVTNGAINFGPIHLHVPQYLMQYDNVAFEVNSLVHSGKIILDSMKPDYILRLRNDLDIQEFQNIMFESSDNYIYFYNRVLFLRHIKAFSLTSSEDFINPINYCIPKSIDEITNFANDSEYLVYQNLNYKDAITMNKDEIVTFFDDAKFNQNIANSNFISMRYDRQVWCIEEKYNPTINVSGYVYRWPTITVGDYSRGVGICFDDVLNEDRNHLSYVLTQMFYFYGTPFVLKYTKVNGKFIICDIDLSVNLSNPRIEQIYTSTNLPFIN